MTLPQVNLPYSPYRRSGNVTQFTANAITTTDASTQASRSVTITRTNGATGAITSGPGLCAR